MATFITRTGSVQRGTGNRRAGVAGAGLVLALALTGCGGGDGPGASGAPPSSSKPAPSGSNSAPSPSGAGAAADGGGGTVSGEELAAVLAEMNTELGIGGTVLEEAQLKQSTARNAEAMKGVEYSPCNPTEGTDPTRSLSEASMGAIAIEGNVPGTSDVISVLSWASEEPVIKEIEVSKRQLSSCPEFTITANGQTVSTVGEPVDMPVVGDASQAYVTRRTANGVTQTSLTLTAWSGTNSAQIIINEAGDPGEGVRILAPILEDVLERIEG